MVPRSLIVDQNDLTVTEAIQNVSNTQGTNTLAIGTTGPFGQMTVRGFTAQQYLDGINVMYNAGDRDSLVNVERVEVLKGPNAILYGGGAGSPLGGAINVVSKLPTDKASLETGVTFGTNNYVQPYFDFNQPLSADKTVLFRFTGSYTSNDTFVDVVHQDRYSLNPTLTLTNKEDTTLTIQGRVSRLEQQAYQAIDEFNRAFHKQEWSGFVQQPFLVTADNVNAEGGEKDMFFPSNGYKEHYLAIWGAAGK